MHLRLPVRAIAVAFSLGLIGSLVASAATRDEYVASKPNPLSVPIDAFVFGPEAGGLKIDVWATSPHLFSPVSMDIDPQGRAWVVEGAGYGGGIKFADGTSIVVISDTDDDGKADESHVFVAERGVRWAPLGIAVFDNVIVLSATPDVIVYTDVNRDAKFDPAVDKREVLLTGFQGGGHDHTLHAVVPTPGGQWALSYGNKGANVTTPDGRHIISGCYYGNAGAIGKDSSDGHRYIGGAAMIVNPDGTGARVISHNLRNTHDMVVSSMGDVFHNDNDDPAHARATWAMEYSNFGYADLMDGSKSWEEAAKPWEERKPDPSQDPFGYGNVHGNAIRMSATHWRETYPGTCPPGDVYGPGSPTGVTIIEGDELGDGFRGMYLACDMVHKAVLAYRPTLTEAQIEMKRAGYFLNLKKESQGEPLLPTDVTVGTDGAIYLADFYSNTSRTASNASGTIYRITRADGKPMKRPTVSFDTIAGQIEALANPNPGVRWVAAKKLVESGDAAASELVAFVGKHKDNPYVQSRAVWVLAEIGDAGRGFVEKLLSEGDEPQRIVAYRALRHAAPDRLLDYAAVAADDKSAAVRREVALSLRDVPLDKCGSVLTKLIDGYDGQNRWYVESIGYAVDRNETAVYDTIIRPMAGDTPPQQWDAKLVNLAWRMHTTKAADDIDAIVRNREVDLAELRHLIMAMAVYSGEADRAHKQELVEAWAKLPKFASDDFQQTIEEVLQRDIRLIPPVQLTQDYKIPTVLGAETQVSSAADIAKLAGDAKRGQLRAAMCLMCHKIDAGGVAFGPDLSAWGSQRTIEEIAREIVNPSEKLAHGFEQPVRISGRGHVAEGFLTNYSYHAGTCKIKVLGGQYLKIPFRSGGYNIQHLKDHSWMPPASKMGLTDQDVRDIAEYLKTK